MQNKFTQKAQNSLNRALSEASKLGHSHIGSEHLLLALAEEKDSIAARVLGTRGLSPSYVLRSITDIVGRGEPSELTPSDLTPNAKRVIERSAKIADKRGCTYIGTEHLLCALLECDGSCAKKIIEASGIPCSLIIDDLWSCQSVLSGTKRDTEALGEVKQKKNAAALSLYTYDMTDSESLDKTDPTIGRDSETERIIQILSRRTKNNPCLIGDPGVGKTAVVEGLARRIRLGNVPVPLAAKKILRLDIPSMIAGAKYRGEFEDRMKCVISEAQRDPDVILFVDEVHVIMGAGAAEGAVDAANILKPALSRGQIHMIGATTVEEYRKHIERDGALERRFQPIFIEEPSEDDAIRIITGLKEKYEAHHRIKIDDDAISLAVRLSSRYIPDRRLPDKAIDVIDEAAAKISLMRASDTAGIDLLESKLLKTRQKKEECIGFQDFDGAVTFREKELSLKKEISEKQFAFPAPVLTGEHITRAVESISGIPIDKMKDASGLLLELEDRLKKRIIGQDEAIFSVCSAIRRARIGLRDPDRPLGSFLFVGKTGVGKTELATVIAEELLGSKDTLIRFDMSEYMEKHSVSKLIGSPPGYVGYGEGALLVERVRRRPYSVVLFDEVEKAHADVLNILLQILEDGKISDAQGRVASFKNAVIIMTSNVGATGLQRVAGFGSSGTTSEGMRSYRIEEIKKCFKSELLSRIDEIILFNELRVSELERIAEGMLSDLSRRAKEIGISIDFDPSVAKMIAQSAGGQKDGAREIRRIIAKTVEDRISTEFLRGKLSQSIPTTLTSPNLKELVFSK